MIGETTVLVTGKRGNGKSLKAVGMMKSEIADGRPTYACNFEGLTVPGVQVLDDPNDWESLPAGSILFVDEAQRFWRARRSGDPPAALQAMETQRHKGITIVLLTQQPTYLDKHIRGLVDLHHHLMLEVGGKASRMWTWKRCMDEPEDANVRGEGDQSLFVFPKGDFGDYKSAETHTIKAKLPRKVWVIGGAAVVVLLLVLSAVDDAKTVMPGHKESKLSSSSSGSSREGGASPGGNVKVLRYETAEEYRVALTPRVPGAPWTAPAFDGRAVVSEPRLFCMSSANGLDGEGRQTGSACHCKTEQGTDVGTDPTVCLTIALHGESYNPFRRADRGMSADRARGDRSPQEGLGGPAVGPVGPGDAVVGVTTPEATVAGYGAIGHGPNAAPTQAASPDAGGP